MWQARFRLGSRPSNADTTRLCILKRRRCLSSWAGHPGCPSHYLAHNSTEFPSSSSLLSLCQPQVHWEACLDFCSKYWLHLSESSLQTAAKINVGIAGPVYTSNSLMKSSSRIKAMKLPHARKLQVNHWNQGWTGLQGTHVSSRQNPEPRTGTAKASGSRWPQDESAPCRHSWGARQHGSKMGFIQDEDKCLHCCVF